MVELNPKARLNVVLNQIVPSIVNHEDKEFQKRALANHEDIANQLNELCEIPVADLPQFFQDARDEIERQTKEVERIEVI
jgi:hypothetical protein